MTQKYLVKFLTELSYEQSLRTLAQHSVSLTMDNNKVHYDPFNGHSYVDLGLPSGTLWATDYIKYNNTDPLNITDFYAWGETGEKSSFTWANYKFGTQNNMTKYNSTDNKTELDATDDVARRKWGGEWHIPTKEQFEELVRYCDLEELGGAFSNNHKVQFMSTINNEAIFLPVTGLYDSRFQTKTRDPQDVNKNIYFEIQCGMDGMDEGSAIASTDSQNRYKEALVYPCLGVCHKPTLQSGTYYIVGQFLGSNLTVVNNPYIVVTVGQGGNDRTYVELAAISDDDCYALWTWDQGDPAAGFELDFEEVDSVVDAIDEWLSAKYSNNFYSSSATVVEESGLATAVRA